MHFMLACCLAVTLLHQAPISVPAFSTWDGKSWAGIVVGTTENDLGKQVQKTKTVGPDPASVRVIADKKGWIIAAILTETNNKGSVCGFTADLERDEPIESLEALQTELGAPPDYAAYAATRFSDWSLAVWKDKGIVAAIQNGSRPLVTKVLLAPPAVLAKNLDLWERDPNPIHDLPRLPVTGIDVSVSADPQDRGIDDLIGERIRHRARRHMEDGGGSGWVAAGDPGARIRASFQLTRRGTTTVSASVSASYKDQLGQISVTESSIDSNDQNGSPVDRAESMFESLMSSLSTELDKKYRRLAWQAEWRQFTGLARPKP